MLLFESATLSRLSESDVGEKLPAGVNETEFNLIKSLGEKVNDL